MSVCWRNDEESMQLETVREEMSKKVRDKKGMGDMKPGHVRPGRLQ